MSIINFFAESPIMTFAIFGIFCLFFGRFINGWLFKIDDLLTVNKKTLKQLENNNKK